MNDIQKYAESKGFDYKDTFFDFMSRIIDELQKVEDPLAEHDTCYMCHGQWHNDDCPWWMAKTMRDYLRGKRDRVQ